MNDLLTEVGRALYGDPWQTQLSRDLGVSDRTVRRWVSGQTPMPPGVLDDLLTVARRRRGEISDAVIRIKAARDERKAK